MRWLLVCLVLSACTGGQPPPQIVVVMCASDKVIQPVALAIAQAVAPAVGTASAGVQAGATLDSMLVHPAVVAACAAINAKPASVLPVTGATQ